jgi:hypothetical protein
VELVGGSQDAVLCVPCPSEQRRDRERNLVLMIFPIGHLLPIDLEKWRWSDGGSWSHAAIASSSRAGAIFAILGICVLVLVLVHVQGILVLKYS